MKKDVNPLVAILVVAVALGAVWYFYTFVFHGKQTGYVGSPGTPGGAPINKVPGYEPKKPPAGPPTRELYGLPPLPKGTGQDKQAAPAKK